MPPAPTPDCHQVSDSQEPSRLPRGAAASVTATMNALLIPAHPSSSQLASLSQTSFQQSGSPNVFKTAQSLSTSTLSRLQNLYLYLLSWIYGIRSAQGPVFSMASIMKANEARAIVVAERVTSILSVAGAFFIIITFLWDHRFRKPINRLVFYASWGNLFANVATLISRSGIVLGVDAPLCQFQGFLIQWFMPADALWTLAMAINVYLTFFRQYDAAALRALEWKYLVFCYGLPFVPAIIYCFIKTEAKGKFYGSANLWCWVSSNWNPFRIATFYGPVWIIIVANVIIYIKVGMVVFKWRKHLISQNRSQTGSNKRDSQAVTVSVPMRDLRTPAKGYEVSIVSQVPHHSPSRSKRLSLSSPTALTASHGRFPSTNTTTIEDQGNVQRSTTIVHPVSSANPHRIVDANRATLSYCYTALLFFIALLVTWVPSTVNRVYTLVSPGSPSPFALDFASGLVLPLQGFWNTVIYIVTSLAACKALATDIHDRFSCRTESRSGPSGKSGLPPSMKRHAAQLGSTDTSESDRRRRQEARANAESNGRDITTTPNTLATQTNAHRTSESNDRLSSPKADIVMSFDGRKRVIHHDYRSSVPKHDYDPYQKRQEGEYGDAWVLPPSRDEEEESQPQSSGLRGAHNETLLYESSSEDGDKKSYIGAHRKEVRVSNIGFAH